MLVRNLSVGRFEAVFEGDEKAVQQVVSWCQQGPPNAYVTGVESHSEAVINEYLSFSIRY